MSVKKIHDQIITKEWCGEVELGSVASHAARLQTELQRPVLTHQCASGEIVSDCSMGLVTQIHRLINAFIVGTDLKQRFLMTQCSHYLADRYTERQKF